jgi:hypothetical protein
VDRVHGAWIRRRGSGPQRIDGGEEDKGDEARPEVRSPEHEWQW